jgi:Domain of unknown function (DUF892)
MAKAAHSEELKAAFEKHHGETEGHIVRLDRVFASINQKPQGKTCAAIVGTDEGTEIMVEYKGRLRSTPVFSPPLRSPRANPRRCCEPALSNLFAVADGCIIIVCCVAIRTRHHAPTQVARHRSLSARETWC